MILINLQHLDVDLLLRRRAHQAYKKTPKGRAAAARYRARPETQAYMSDYHAAYVQQPEVRAARRERKKTPLGRAAAARYKAGSAGRATQRRRYRNVTRGRDYGLTPEQVEAMYVARDGRCETCGREMSRTRVRGGAPVACIDHCHTTGAVRGMLCVACNTTLGKMRDNPALLRTLADYLEKKR